MGHAWAPDPWNPNGPTEQDFLEDEVGQTLDGE
jgi:hypothetical protein